MSNSDSASSEEDESIEKSLKNLSDDEVDESIEKLENFKNNADKLTNSEEMAFDPSNESKTFETATESTIEKSKNSEGNKREESKSAC